MACENSEVEDSIVGMISESTAHCTLSSPLVANAGRGGMLSPEADRMFPRVPTKSSISQNDVRSVASQAVVRHSNKVTQVKPKTRQKGNIYVFGSTGSC